MSTGHKLTSDILAAIDNHKGISKANKFLITNLNLPYELRNKYQDDLQDMKFFCDSSFFPGRNMATVEFRTGSISESYIHANNFNPTVTLTFNLTNDMFIKKIFDDWQEYIIPITNKEKKLRTNIMKYPNNYRGTFDLEKLNTDLEDSTAGIKTYSIKFLKAFPKQLDQINVNFSSQEPTKLTVQMAYSNWRMN